MGYIKRLLTNNYRFKPENPEYRRVFLLNAVLLSLFALCVFYSFFNIFAELDIIKAAVTITAAVCALLAFFYFHATDNVKAASFITVLLISVTLVAFFNVVLNQYYSFLWLSAFPPVAYFLLGKKYAGFVVLLFTAYLVLFFSGYKGWEPAVFDFHSLFNIAGALISLILLIHYFELSRKEVEDTLNKCFEDLREQDERLRLILDSAAEGIFGVNLNGDCTFCNKACLDLLGYDIETDLLSKNMAELISHETSSGVNASELSINIMRTMSNNERIYAVSGIFRRADGRDIRVEYYSYPQFEKGKIAGAVITFLDISERVKNEERIIYLNNYDILTGFYNRTYFEELQKSVDNSVNLPLSVIYADINSLKLTNDIFGHDSGDMLIRKCARAIRKSCRKRDIISRIGGDEFIVFLPNTNYADAVKIIDTVITSISNENVNIVKCSMAMGCDTKLDTDTNLKRTMKNAEIEMYRQKALYKRNYNENIINTITDTLHSRNPLEKEHSENVSRLCVQIGKALGKQDTEIKKIRDAAYLHDIGKIVLSPSVLNKENIKMTEAERFEKQQHTVAGYRILNLFDDTMELAESVFSHHEYWDGTGYPKGLTGEEIPEHSRIISIAEVYDVLVRRMSEREALEKMSKLKGKRFDPEITELFISLRHGENTAPDSLNSEIS